MVYKFLFSCLVFQTLVYVSLGDVLVNTKFLATDPTEKAWFGYASSSNSPNFFLVSAPADSTYISLQSGKPVSSAGAVYFYSVPTGSAVGFSPIKKLYPTTPGAFDFFGYSVASDSAGNVVIGAPRNENNLYHDSGIAYFYKFASPSTTTPIGSAPYLPSEESAYYGASVAVDNGVFYVAHTGGANPSIYVYNNTGTLLGYVSAAFPKFGFSLAAGSGYFFVGAPGSNSAGYVFVYNSSFGYVQLQHPTPSATDLFGYSVAVTGNWAVVGSPGSRSAHVYQLTAGTWTHQATLTASDNVAYSDFGTSVGIATGISIGNSTGNFIVVGAPGDGPTAICKWGAAYLYQQDSNGNWIQLYKLVAANRGRNSVGDFFGKRVGLSGNSVVVPVYYSAESVSGNLSYHVGAVYYSRINCPTGTWGSGCTQCTCVNGDCNDGVEGTGTCKTCQPGYYGVNCDKNCSCVNGVCNYGVTGDGKCTSCTTRYYGETCDSLCACPLDTCSDGINGTGACTCDLTKRWGDKCQNTCNCTHGICNAATGACAECNEGYYGPNCDACICVNGDCEDGLLGDGYCTQCNLGYYARNCTLPCPCRGGSTVPAEANGCTISGVCLCKPGYILSSDKTYCIVPPPPTGDLWTLLPTYGWVLIILAFVAIAVCLIWAFAVIYLRKQKHKKTLYG